MAETVAAADVRAAEAEDAGAADAATAADADAAARAAEAGTERAAANPWEFTAGPGWADALRILMEPMSVAPAFVVPALAQNARTGHPLSWRCQTEFESRATRPLAKKIMMERLTWNAAAAAFNVNRKTAAKWLGRYRVLGLPGLRDRSSRPLHSPRRTSSELIAQVIALRRQLRPAYQIAHATRLSPATISRILRRAHLNRWRHLHPAPPVVRYEHPRPAICSTSTSRA